MTWMLRLCALGLVCAVPGASAGEFVFESAHVRLSIAGNGLLSGLVEKDTGQELLGSARLPLAILKKGGQTFPVSEIRDEGASVFKLVFGQSGVEAQYRITSHKDYVEFALIQVQPPDIQQITVLQIASRALPNSGPLINARWSDGFTVCLMSLDHRVDSRPDPANTMTSSVYREFGMDGAKVALIAVPTNLFLSTVEEVEHDFGLPSPTIDGQWAKVSLAGRASYLFADLTEENAQELIDYAKLGGFKYILIYSSTWAQSLGTYSINRRNYPHGEDGIRATIAKCHAAGLRVGLHMLTSFAGQNDPLASPVPSPWLLKAPVAKLAADLSSDGAEIATDTAIPGGANRGMDLQIDNEIIRVSAANPAAAPALRCRRGFAGTQATFHARGTQIFRLANAGGGAYLADVRTPLRERIAERIGELINRCGFDMIYFDGGELNSADGPFWYWGSEQQASILARTHRELRIQGSGFNHWSWHMWTRGTSDDYVAVGTKSYLDYHKIGEVVRGYRAEFMPAELGWLGLLSDAPDHAATTPDEMELYAVRALALDIPLSIETTVEQLRRNGRTREMLQQLGEYERLRTERKVPAPVREDLARGEWHLVDRGNAVLFSPIRYESHQLSIPGRVVVKDVPQPEPLRFRLQALPVIAQPGDRSNISLTSPIVLGVPEARAPMPGAPAGHADLSNKPLDLRKHRALAVTLEAGGPAAPASPPAVLNVQLEATGGSLRDYYVDVNFTGRRTVVIPQSTADRMLPEFRPAPANYPVKSALRAFNYGSITGVTFRWMRQDAANPVHCRVLSVEALSETDVPLSSPRVSIGKATLSIPGEMATGDYAEYWGEGPIRIFDRNGVLLRSILPQAAIPQLRPGETRVEVDATEPARASLTTIVLGRPVPAN